MAYQREEVTRYRRQVLLIILLVEMTSSFCNGQPVGVSTPYLPVIDPSGHTQCAYEGESTSIIKMIPPVKGFPDPTQCGFHCNSLGPASCFGYNVETFAPSLTRCRLLTRLPSGCWSMDNCSFYSIYADGGCPIPPPSTTAAPVPLCPPTAGRFPYTDAQNCSFPFTFNRTLFISCTTNYPEVTNASDPCMASACLLANRTVAVCLPPAQFVAQNAVQNVVIPNLNRTVLTQSIAGWIIIHQKLSSTTAPSFSWRNTWTIYKMEFGSASSNFWFGLENLYQLTSSQKFRLRIEIQQSSTNFWFSAEYWNFNIGDENGTFYQLTVSGYSGDAGDAIQYTGSNGVLLMNGMSFTTSDSTHDRYYSQPVQNGASCATASPSRGGWWYNNCLYACLTCESTDFSWQTLVSPTTLATARMMIRPQ